MLSALRNRESPPYLRETFRADVIAGITMSATFVPIAMSLGVISGMGPLAGLWCGVVVGMISALFGGTSALVSGPSAVLAVMVSTLLIGDGRSLQELALIVVMAGAFQIVLGLTGLGRFVSYMPHMVLTGIMSGIGALILWAQVNKLHHIGVLDLTLAGCLLAVMFLWPSRLGRILPSGLAVIGMGWLVAQFVPGIEQLGPVPSGFPVPVLEMPSLSFVAGAVGPAVLIALISSVYSLMIALVADTFTGTQHNPNRQLFGLGLGNLTAGIIGIMPGSANIATITAHRFGGKTVVAGFVCMVIIAALILGLGSYVALVPLASLSAIVMFVGWNMIDFTFLRKVPWMEPRYSTVMLLIMGVTVLVDPFIAIVVGVIAAYVVNATKLESLELDSVISIPLLDTTLGLESSDEFQARAGLLAFRGSFTMASSRNLIRLIGNEVRDHEVVIFDLSSTTNIDDSAAQLLASLISRARLTGTGIVIFGINDRIRGTLYAFGVLDNIGEDQIVGSMEEAKDLARTLL